MGAGRCGGYTLYVTYASEYPVVLLVLAIENEYFAMPVDDASVPRDGVPDVDICDLSGVECTQACLAVAQCFSDCTGSASTREIREQFALNCSVVVDSGLIGPYGEWANERAYAEEVWIRGYPEYGIPSVLSQTGTSCNTSRCGGSDGSQPKSQRIPGPRLELNRTISLDTRTLLYAGTSVPDPVTGESSILFGEAKVNPPIGAIF